jgi:hypothetical protein
LIFGKPLLRLQARGWSSEVWPCQDRYNKLDNMACHVHCRWSYSELVEHCLLQVRRIPETVGARWWHCGRGNAKERVQNS